MSIITDELETLTIRIPVYKPAAETKSAPARPNLIFLCGNCETEVSGEQFCKGCGVQLHPF